jgi:hypothetical protein
MSGPRLDSSSGLVRTARRQPPSARDLATTSIVARTRLRDAWRDAELARVYGVRVLRIDAELVERDVYAAMAIVRSAL